MPMPDNFWQRIGYFFTYYMIVMVFIAIMHPLAQIFLKPLVALVFPISEDSGDFWKTLGIATAFYWVGVAFTLITHKKKTP